MFWLLAFAGVAIAGGVTQRVAESRDRKRWPAPGRLIDVDGERIHVVVEGSGPTVLFDSGLGGSILEWAAVAADLARDFTVVRYDRPGFGWSPPSSVDPGPQRAADRMHTLLHVLRVPLPAILVGHSLGGIHVSAAAALYPEVVAGLVLVDPSHEDMLDDDNVARTAARAAKVMKGIATTAPVGSARLFGRVYARAATSAIRAELTDAGRDSLRCSTKLTACSVNGIRSSIRELSAVPSSLGQAKQISRDHPMRAIPVTIISADAPALNPREQQGRTAIRALHEAQVAGWSFARLVLAPNSGHLVPVDEPDLIARCVRETWDARHATAWSH